MLSCGIHVCRQPCHEPNKCPPCAKKSIQSCVCGNRQQERNCDSLIWTCDKLCNKMYDCGRHKCKAKCHSECGPCPFGLPRSCPCGKEKSQAPCTEDIGPCGNTCQKTLECGNHICAERCHRGDCGPCLEIVEKKCRCGLHSKELPCSKLYLCDAKCKQTRDCNKHPCNRKVNSENDSVTEQWFENSWKKFQCCSVVTAIAHHAIKFAGKCFRVRSTSVRLLVIKGNAIHAN